MFNRSESKVDTLKDFELTASYIDNKEKDINNVFKHSLLDIEYLLKVRNGYKLYEILIFNPNNKESIDYVDIFFDFLRKNSNINFDLIMSKIRDNEFNVNIEDFVIKNKKNIYDLIFDTLENGYFRFGISYEDSKSKKNFISIKDVFDENLCTESLFNTLRIMPKDFCIKTNDLVSLESKYEFRPSILYEEKENIDLEDNLEYDIKQYLCKDFMLKSKNKIHDVYFDCKYIDLENIEMYFHFDKAKKGLVNVVLSHLNEFTYRDVNWSKLYDLYYDNKPATIEIEDSYIENYINYFILKKRYNVVCNVYSDDKELFFKIKLKEKVEKDKYSV